MSELRREAAGTGAAASDSYGLAVSLVTDSAESLVRGNPFAAKEEADASRRLAETMLEDLRRANGLRQRRV